MSESEERTNEALRRFEERHQETAPAEPPADEESMDDQFAAEVAAEAAAALGIEGEKVDLPPQLVRGILIYELEDGTYGSQPVGAMASLDEALSLTDQFTRRAEAQLIAGEVKKVLAQAEARRQQVRRALGGVAGALSRVGARRNQ